MLLEKSKGRIWVVFEGDSMSFAVGFFESREKAEERIKELKSRDRHYGLAYPDRYGIWDVELDDSVEITDLFGLCLRAEDSLNVSSGDKNETQRSLIKLLVHFGADIIHLFSTPLINYNMKRFIDLFGDDLDWVGPLDLLERRVKASQTRNRMF